MPIKKVVSERFTAPTADETAHPKTVSIQIKANLKELLDGIFKLLSFKPAVLTFTFCRYSSTIASISVELSESESFALEMQSISELMSVMILDSSIGLSM
jgi:hypothetical protein